MAAIASPSGHLLPARAKNAGCGAGQYLTFMLDQEVYGLDILNIKEIIDYDHVTEVPMLPHFVRGVINLRGRVVPVIDLMAHFGREPMKIRPRTGIVIAETGDAPDAVQRDIGIMVDAVNQVVDIGQQDIEPPPNFGCGIRRGFISGMAKRNGGFIVLLDVDQVLSLDEIARLNGISNCGGS